MPAVRACFWPGALRAQSACDDADMMHVVVVVGVVVVVVVVVGKPS